MKVHKVVLLFGVLTLFSSEIHSSESRDSLSWIPSWGFLTRCIWAKLEQSYLKEHSIDGYPVKTKEVFAQNMKLAERPEYNSVCHISYQRGNMRYFGCGVLIQSPDGGKAILTAAHVADESSSKVTVQFLGDQIKRDVVGKPYYPRKGVDLALIFLENYPDVQPAEREYTLFCHNQEKFGHSVGFGDFLFQTQTKFYTSYSAELGTLVIPNRTHQAHVVANYYRIFRENYFNRSEQGENIQTRPSKSSQIHHPLSQESYPSSHATPGFSGTPIFSDDNKVFGIISTVDFRSHVEIGSYPSFLGIYGYLHSMAYYYNKICGWTHEWGLGDKAHYIYGPGLLYCLASSVVKNKRMPMNLLTGVIFLCQYFLNNVGWAIGKFAYQYPSYKVMSTSMLTNQAVEIAPCNKVIDEYLNQRVKE